MAWIRLQGTRLRAGQGQVVSSRFQLGTSEIDFNIEGCSHGAEVVSPKAACPEPAAPMSSLQPGLGIYSNVGTGHTVQIGPGPGPSRPAEGGRQ